MKRLLVILIFLLSCRYTANAENVIISTDGQSCAALATDRGEGQVHVKNSNINTGVSKASGRGCPLQPHLQNGANLCH